VLRLHLNSITQLLIIAINMLRARLDSITQLFRFIIINIHSDKDFENQMNFKFLWKI